MKKNKLIRRPTDAKLLLGHPIENIRNLAEAMDRAFEDAWSPEFRKRNPGIECPDLKLNLRETSKEIMICAELPEVAKKDLHINVTEDVVIIFAEQNTEYKYKGRNGQGASRSYQRFSRTLRLPAPVKTDGARASFRDRVLKIHLPKAKESLGQRIDIKEEGEAQ